MSSCRFLYHDGVVLRSGEAPLISTFLQSHTGAYTTTRTINDGTSFLFWVRHLRRLAGSVRILLNSKPEFLFGPGAPRFSINQQVAELSIRSVVNGSMGNALELARQESGRSNGEELAVTVLVSGDVEKLNGINDENGDLERRVLELLDVWFISGPTVLVPLVFGNMLHLWRWLVAGRMLQLLNIQTGQGRLRKPLEKLRPVLTTELLLSNDGDHLLEGCITNFFVVSRKKPSEKFSGGSLFQFEVQTAPITDGVLPGVVRELVNE